MAVSIAENRASKATDAIGRKLRKDALILGSGVASYPARTSEISWDDPGLQNWVALTHQYLLNKYGEQYVSLVAHGDEEWWHLHYIVLPDIDKQHRLDIASIHEGVKARNNIKSGSAKEKMRAYKAAMRDFQTEYYEHVSIKIGLTRDGPKRRRLSRKEWMIEKDAAKRLASSIEKNKRIKKSLSLVSHINENLKRRYLKLNERERKLALILKSTPKFLESKRLLKKSITHNNK